MENKYDAILARVLSAIKKTANSTGMCLPTLNVLDETLDATRLDGFFPIITDDINGFIRSKIKDNSFAIIAWGPEGRGKINPSMHQLSSNDRVVCVYEDRDGNREVWVYHNGNKTFENKGRFDNYPIGKFFQK